LGLFWKVQGLKFTFRIPEMLYVESNTFVDDSEECVKMVISAVGGEFAHRTPELKLPEKAALCLESFRKELILELTTIQPKHSRC